MTAVDIAAKIRSVQELGQLLKERGNKKVVLCHGEFDLLHFGHTRYFKAAGKLGDLLVVTLTPDRFINKGPGRPVFNEAQRAESIANLAFVDYVAVNEWPTAMETLEILRPDIYAKGAEYQRKVDVTGRLELEKTKIESLGGELRFIDEIVYSSSKLLNNHFNVFGEEATNFLREVARKSTSDQVLAALDALASCKPALVGDGGWEEITLLEGPDPAQIKTQFQQPWGAQMGLEFLRMFCPQATRVGQSSLTHRSYYSSQGVCRLRVQVAHPDLGLGLQDPAATAAQAVVCFAGSTQALAALEAGGTAAGLHVSFGSLTLRLLKPAQVQLASAGIVVDLPLSERKGIEAPLSQAPAPCLLFQDSQLLHQRDGRFEPAPDFGMTRVQGPPMDWQAAVFALTAVCRSVGMAEDWIRLLASAAAVYCRRQANQGVKFEKQEFQKFIIALLNL